MIWTEQKINRDEYIYKVEDFFGQLEINAKQRLNKYELDAMQDSIAKGATGESDFSLHTKDGIIQVHYKFNKKEQILWDKK